jgi:hypothetical protein
MYWTGRPASPPSLVPDGCAARRRTTSSPPDSHGFAPQQPLTARISHHRRTANDQHVVSPRAVGRAVDHRSARRSPEVIERLNQIQPAATRESGDREKMRSAAAHQEGVWLPAATSPPPAPRCARPVRPGQPTARKPTGAQPGKVGPRHMAPTANAREHGEPQSPRVGLQTPPRRDRPTLPRPASTPQRHLIHHGNGPTIAANRLSPAPEFPNHWLAPFDPAAVTGRRPILGRAPQVASRSACRSSAGLSCTGRLTGSARPGSHRPAAASAHPGCLAAAPRCRTGCRQSRRLRGPATVSAWVRTPGTASPGSASSTDAALCPSQMPARCRQTSSRSSAASLATLPGASRMDMDLKPALVHPRVPAPPCALSRREAAAPAREPTSPGHCAHHVR